MSIASELTNLEGNIGDAYDAVSDMSGIIPQHKNMANLDQAIRTIPQNAGTTYTAGNGINIDANNEISIDDTVVAELSDLPGVMTGATSGTAGTSGLVPAPAAGDEAKVLSGAGTWVNQPTVPTVNDATLTIQHNGTTVQTFTANQSTAATANIETIWADDAIPTTQVPPVTTSMIDDEAVTAAKVCGGTSGDTLANGALVEVVGTTTGSSRNYAWKYADGRLINFQHYDISGNATTAWGSAYSGVQMTPRNYAVAFTTTPIVMAQLDWTAASGNCWLAQANEKGNSTTNHPGGYQLVRPTSMSNLQTGISIVAYGFWK